MTKPATSQQVRYPGMAPVNPLAQGVMGGLQAGGGFLSGMAAQRAALQDRQSKQYNATAPALINKGYLGPVPGAPSTIQGLPGLGPRTPTADYSALENQQDYFKKKYENENRGVIRDQKLQDAVIKDSLLLGDKQETIQTALNTLESLRTGVPIAQKKAAGGNNKEIVSMSIDAIKNFFGATTNSPTVAPTKDTMRERAANLKKRIGRNPTQEELASEMSLTVDQLRALYTSK